MKQDQLQKQFEEVFKDWKATIGNIQTVTNMLEHILTDLTWDQLLLTLSNVAFHKHQKETDRRKKKRWLAHCHVLHDAMESEKARRLQEKLKTDLHITE